MRVQMPLNEKFAVLGWTLELGISTHSRLRVELRVTEAGALSEVVSMRGKDCKVFNRSTELFTGIVTGIDAAFDASNAEGCDMVEQSVTITALSESARLDVEPLPPVLGNNNSCDQKSIAAMLKPWLDSPANLGELGEMCVDRLITKGSTAFGLLKEMAEQRGGFLCVRDGMLSFDRASDDPVEIDALDQSLSCGAGYGTTDGSPVFNFDKGSIGKSVEPDLKVHHFDMPVFQRLGKSTGAGIDLRQAVPMSFSWQAEVDAGENPILVGKTVRPKRDVFGVERVLVKYQVIEHSVKENGSSSFIEGVSPAVARVGQADPYLTLIAGHVCGLDDPERRGRIRVRLPWHSGAEDLLVEQMSSAWGENDGQWRGMLNPPGVNDWVLVCVSTDCPPVCLGILQKGGKSRLRNYSPNEDFLVWRRGLFELRAAKKAVELSVNRGSESGLSIQICDNNTVSMKSGESSISLDESGINLSASVVHVNGLKVSK